LTKSRETEWQFRGEITALLSLVFILMLSLVGALIESASIQMTRSCKRADVNLALESVFAEYHPEMLHTYDLFVRFGSTKDVLENRLAYYGATNMTHDLLEVELLTDHGGSVYYEQAVRYMKDWLGLEADLSGDQMDLETTFSYEDEQESLSNDINRMLEAEEHEISGENNLLHWAEGVKNTGLLPLVVPDLESLSGQSITLEGCASFRTLEEGSYEAPKDGDVTDKAFFVAYLTEHFSDYVKPNAGKTLLYEREYLLGGQGSDKENLEVVCNKLVSVRMPINYAYLLTDTGRQAEAEALAVTLCTLLMNPEISEVVKQALLLTWAYGESIVDVRALLKGKKVPVIKTAETWQLQLANVTKLGTEGEASGEKEFESGLCYGDYLKGFLLLASKEELCMRSLDLMEANLHIKADQCITKVKIQSTLKLRRGLKDTFLTEFGYQ